jgi:Protein of unknown function (DUF3987)
VAKDLPTSIADFRAHALAGARKLAEMGVPIFCARLMRDGEPDRRDKRWLGWQKSRAGDMSLRAVSAWKPGDALCAVMGVACDALDPDIYKPEGKKSLKLLMDAVEADSPELWWQVETPSGGRHYLIDCMGLGSHNDILPSLDLKGGRADGTSRGFIFLPPTERPSKVTGEVRAYRELAPLRQMNGHGNIQGLRKFLARQLEAGREPDGNGGGARQKPSALAAAALAAGDGGQRGALMAYVAELEKRGYERDDIITLVRTLVSSPEWRNFPSDDGPWWPARRGNPDRHLESLLHKPGTIIPDARGEEAADLELPRDWAPPRPVRAGYGPGGTVLAAVPEYPVVDGVLGRLVKSAKHLPPALVGGAGLAALAAAASGWTLTMPDGSAQRPVIWVPLIAPPGAGKTPALELAFECIRDLDESTMREYLQERAEWSKRPKDERGPEPGDYSIIIDDFTLERLARRLHSGDSRACVVSDELSGFLGGFGRYGSGGGKNERSRMLTLWTSSPWRYERVAGQIDLFIRHPVVSVVGGIQPDYQSQLGGDQDGMRTRWLPHFEPEGDAEYGEERAPAKWVNRLAELYCGEEHDLALDGDACLAWRDYSRKWREAKRAKGVSKTLFEAMSKADQQLARIALVLGAAGGDRDILSEVWIHEGARIVNYCLGVWAALPAPEVFAVSERDRAMREKVTNLVAWLERHGGRASRTEILRAQVAGVSSSKDVTDLLRAYKSAYPGCVLTETAKKGGPKKEIVVAPGRFGP